MPRDAQDARSQSTLKKYADRPPMMTRDAELFKTHVDSMKTQRWQHKN